MEKYDVVVVGGGPAGVMTAYELIEKKPSLRILVLESGKDIYHRVCPISAGKVKSCIGCKPCSIMRGFGGAGAFSDGKYNFTTKFGGWLNEYLDDATVMDLIHYVDAINCKHGAPVKVFTTKGSSLGKRALEHDLHLLEASVRHLGTENNLKMLEATYEYLKEKVTFRFECPVAHLCSDGKGENAVELESGERIAAEIAEGNDFAVSALVLFALVVVSSSSFFASVLSMLIFPSSRNSSIAVHLVKRVEGCQHVSRLPHGVLQFLFRRCFGVFLFCHADALPELRKALVKAFMQPHFPDELFFLVRVVHLDALAHEIGKPAASQHPVHQWQRVRVSAEKHVPELYFPRLKRFITAVKKSRKSSAVTRSRTALVNVPMSSAAISSAFVPERSASSA